MKHLARKLALLTCLLLVGGFRLAAQQDPVSGTISAQGSTCTTGVCVVMPLLRTSTASVVVAVNANASGNTLQFEVSADGTNWVAVNAFPPNSTTAATSTTSTGQWTVSVAGMAAFRVRCSTFVSGTASIYLAPSNAVSASVVAGTVGSSGGTTTPALPTTGLRDFWDLKNSLKGQNGNTLTNCASGSPTALSGQSQGYSFITNQCFDDPTAAADLTLAWIGSFTLPNPPDATLYAPSSASSLMWSPIGQNGSGAANSGSQLLYNLNNPTYLTPATTYPEIAVNFNGAGNVALNTVATPSGSHVFVWVRGVSGCVTTTTCANDILYVDGKILPQALVSVSPSGGNDTGTWKLGGSATGCAHSCFYNGNIFAYAKWSGQLAADAAIQASNFLLADAANRGIAIAYAPAYSTGDEIAIYGTSMDVNSDIRSSITFPSGLNNPAFDVTGNPAYTCAHLRQQAPFALPGLYRPTGRNLLIVDCGTNDASAAQAFSDMGGLVRYAKTLGWKVCVTSMVSRTGSDPQKNQLDLMLEQGWQSVLGADCYNDVASDPGIGADGASVGANFTDGIHYSTVGRQQHAAPIYQKTIWRMLGNPYTTGIPTVYKVGTAMPVYPTNSIYVNSFGGTATAPTFTVPFPVVAADGARLSIKWTAAGATTISSITDTGGDTCAASTGQATRVQGVGTFYTWVWNCVNMTAEAATADTFTITFSDASATSVIAHLTTIHGVPTAAIEDVASTAATGTSTALSSASVTPGAAFELAIGMHESCCSQGTLTPTAPFVVLNSTADIAPFGIPNQAIGDSFQVLPTTTALSYSGTLGVSSTWLAQISVYKRGNFAAIYNMSDLDSIFYTDATGGSGTLNLPDATGLTGTNITVRGSQNASSNTMTIGARNAQTINGLATLPLPNNGTIIARPVIVSYVNPSPQWVAVTNNAPQTISLQSAYTNATNGFTNVSDGTRNMAFPVAANATYHMDCRLPYQAAATGGLNIEFTGPAGFTALAYSMNSSTSASASNNGTAVAYSTSIGAAIVTATTNFPATVSFDLVNGATAGTVQLLAAASATVANGLTIAKGASCTMVQQ